MSSIAALLAESDAALGALAGVDDAHAPAIARAAADILGALALELEAHTETGASLLLDELAALCRGAAAANAERRAPMVAAVREGFATLCATGAATRAAVESVAEVNRLRALRSTAPLRLAPLLAATPAVAAALLPSQLARRARQWRATFQHGLTAWLRGQGDAAEPLRIVLARVADIASESPSRAFWQAAALFTDALPPTPMRASAGDRRWLVRIDGALRRIADEGANAFDDPQGGLTDDLLAALVELRPQALPPRGAARAALLRFLQAELATLRADFAASGRAPHTAPAAVRQVADTLGLLELCASRRRLLATCEQLRAHAGDEQRLAELSALMFELEGTARLSSGEPVLAPPPSLARELSALAEVLAEPVPSSGAELAAPRRPSARDAELLAAVGVIEERRDRVDGGVASARQRLLDVDESAAALREELMHLELTATDDDTVAGLAGLRAQLASLNTRSTSLEASLRDLLAPLAAQSRAQQQLRRLLESASLANLAARLERHARRTAAQAGIELSLRFEDDGEPLSLPLDTTAELFVAMLEHALAGHDGGALWVRLGCARQGAWLLPWMRCNGATVSGVDTDSPTWRAAEQAARRMGGVMHADNDDTAGLLWARLPDPLAMRSLLRIDVGGTAYAVPVADIRAVLRGERSGVDADRACVDLRTVLDVDSDGGTGTALLVEVEGEPVNVLVDDVEDLAAGTPLPLAEPLPAVSALAGAALAGDERLLVVLDIGELVLAQGAGQ